MRTPLTLLALTVLAGSTLAGSLHHDDAPLRAVWLADSREGWAVGDHGTVWHTIDGATTWERQPTGTWASLRAVHFLTPYAGWIVGRTELPDGAGSSGVVLFTADGGATWKELSSGVLPGLNRVKFTDERHGTVSGDPTAVLPTGTFVTADGGRTWAPAPAVRTTPVVPRDTAGAFVEQSTCRVGSHIWSVGRPGSIVFHSPDDGKTWQVQRTSVPVPLHGVHFVDAKVGCAVGDLGTILHTTDGGSTWAVRKAGGQRAAVLFVHAREGSVPLGAMTLLGAKDGYLTTVVSLGGSEKLSAAVRAAGGAAASSDVTTQWLRLHAERSVDSAPDTSRDDALLARLVLAVRTWRPEVIITDVLSPLAPQCDQQVLRHLQDAFQLAADPKAFPEQLDRLGLTPHSAKKLYALSADEKESNVTLDLATFVPELGDATKDFAEPAAMVLGSVTSDRLRFRLVSHRLPGAEQHTSLMQGIDLAVGGPSRRSGLKTASVVSADREKASRTRRRLEAIFAKPESVGGWEPALAQALGALPNLPDDVAARTAVSLGRRLADAGHWTAAREMYAAAADRYTIYPEAVDAVRWLVRYHTSTEVQRRIELGHFPVFQKAAFTALAPVESGIQQASHTEQAVIAPPAFRFSSDAALQQWRQYALDLEPKLAAFGAVYARDPRSQLPLNAARRRLGLIADATRVVKALTPVGVDTPTATRLADELRVLSGDRTFDPKHPWVTCRPTETKPLLDGKLDDACWKAATAMTVEDAGAGYPTDVKLSRDDHYLYLAVICGHPGGKQVPKAAARSRDADLSGRDRVELRLDLDRDGQTFYRLRIDQRGQVAEDCGGDVGWNPRWFVAIEPLPSGWTAEVAVPLTELTGTPLAEKDVWTLDVTRIVPGVGEATTGWRPLTFPAIGK